MRARLARLANIGRVLAHGLHHVHRDRAAAFGKHQRRAYLSIERDEVRLVKGCLVAATVIAGEEVGMVLSRLDDRDRAQGTQARDAAGQAMRETPMPIPPWRMGTSSLEPSFQCGRGESMATAYAGKRHALSDSRQRHARKDAYDLHL